MVLHNLLYRQLNLMAFLWAQLTHFAQSGELSYIMTKNMIFTEWKVRNSITFFNIATGFLFITARRHKATSWILELSDHFVIWQAFRQHCSTRACHIELIEAEWFIYMSANHWFRQWLVAWSTSIHYLIQCWNIANSNLSNKFQWNLKHN